VRSSGFADELILWQRISFSLMGALAGLAFGFMIGSQCTGAAVAESRLTSIPEHGEATPQSPASPAHDVRPEDAASDGSVGSPPVEEARLVQSEAAASPPRADARNVAPLAAATAISTLSRGAAFDVDAGESAAGAIVRVALENLLRSQQAYRESTGRFATLPELTAHGAFVDDPNVQVQVLSADAGGFSATAAHRSDPNALCGVYLGGSRPPHPSVTRGAAVACW
jgi:hypothetical protein